MRKQPEPLPPGMDPEDVNEVNRMLDAAYAHGLEDGQDEGYKAGYKEGHTNGEQSGVETGYREGFEKHKFRDTPEAAILRARINYLKLGGIFQMNDFKDRESYIQGFMDAMQAIGLNKELKQS